VCGIALVLVHVHSDGGDATHSHVHSTTRATHYVSTNTPTATVRTATHPQHAQAQTCTLMQIPDTYHPRHVYNANARTSMYACTHIHPHALHSHRPTRTYRRDAMRTSMRKWRRVPCGPALCNGGLQKNTGVWVREARVQVRCSMGHCISPPNRPSR
jgi:hypothetical protein